MALVSLAHYVFTWATFLGPIILLGDIDDPRSGLREQSALLLTKIQHVLLQPLVRFGRGEPNAVIHLQMLLNSLLWGLVAAITILVITSYRDRRAAT
jgi:hypothetical protein